MKNRGANSYAQEMRNELKDFDARRKTKHDENFSFLSQLSNPDSEFDDILQDDNQMIPANPPTRQGCWSSSRHYDTQVKRMQKMEDVKNYKMDNELETRLAFYEQDDPVFGMHFRRAHKYYSRVEECIGKQDWSIEIMGHVPADDRYSIKYGLTRRSIPTPDELREKGIVGKIKFLLRYYDPYKINRKNTAELPADNEMNERGGYQAISSLPITLPAPNVQVVNQYGQPQLGPGLASHPHQITGGTTQSVFPTAQETVNFKQMFDGMAAMMMQTMSLQMDAISNRQKLVSEGESIGMLKAKIEQLEKNNAELAKLAISAQTQESESETSQKSAIDLLLEQYGPALADFVQKKLFGITPASGSGDIVPAQEAKTD